MQRSPSPSRPGHIRAGRPAPVATGSSPRSTSAGRGWGSNRPSPAASSSGPATARSMSPAAARLQQHMSQQQPQQRSSGANTSRTSPGRSTTPGRQQQQQHQASSNTPTRARERGSFRQVSMEKLLDGRINSCAIPGEVPISTTSPRSKSPGAAGGSKRLSPSQVAQRTRSRLSPEEQEAQNRILLDQHMHRLTAMRSSLGDANVAPDAASEGSPGGSAPNSPRNSPRTGSAPNSPRDDDGPGSPLRSSRPGANANDHRAASMSWIQRAHASSAAANATASKRRMADARKPLSALSPPAASRDGTSYSIDSRLTAPVGAQPSPAQCVALGGGLAKAVVDVPSFLTVQARDADGRTIVTGGAKFKVSVRGPAKATTLFHDNGDGTYFISYICNVSGMYRCDIRCGGFAIPGSPFDIQVTTGEVEPRNCLAEGAGLHGTPAGKFGLFTITCVDGFLNPKVEGGEMFTLVLSNDEAPWGLGGRSRPLEYEIDDCDDGTYRVKYTSSQAGEAYLHVLLGAHGVARSPYLVDVSPGAVHLKSTSFEGAGAQETLAGCETSFEITLRDVFGNVCFNDPLSGLPMHPLDGTSGGLQQHYGGLGYDLAAGGGGHPAGHPDSVRANTMSRPSGGAVNGQSAGGGGGGGGGSSGGSGLTTGSPEYAVVRSQTSASDARNGRGAHGVSVSFMLERKMDDSSPSYDVVHRMVDQRNGKMMMTYLAKTAGIYSMQFSFASAFGGRKTLQGRDPQTSAMEAEAKRQAAGGGGGGGGWKEGVRGGGALINQFSDEHGGTDSEQFSDQSVSLLVEAAAGEVGYAASTDGGQRPGVVSGGSHLPQAVQTVSYKLVVHPGDAFGPASVAVGDGLEKGCGSFNPATFTVFAKDAYGNRKTEGGDPFSLTVGAYSADGVQGAVSDNLDGTYTMTYPASRSGVYLLSATLDGQHCAGSPFKATVSPAGCDALACVIEADCLAGGVCGFAQLVRIFAQDVCGNPRLEGGDRFAVELRGGPEAVFADVEDNGDGSYDCHFVVKKRGVYDMHVLLDGDIPVRGSPFREQMWEAGPCYGPSCSVDGEGIHGAGLNREGIFTIFARDRFGNPVADQGQDFRVTLGGPQRLAADCYDNRDGTYTCMYQASISGVYSLSVMLHGKHVRGSQFAAAVVPGNGAFSASEAASMLRQMDITPTPGSEKESRASVAGGHRAITRRSRSTDRHSQGSSGGDRSGRIVGAGGGGGNTMLESGGGGSPRSGQSRAANSAVSSGYGASPATRASPSSRTSATAGSSSGYSANGRRSLTPRKQDQLARGTPPQQTRAQQQPSSGQLSAALEDSWGSGRGAFGPATAASPSSELAASRLSASAASTVAMGNSGSSTPVTTARGGGRNSGAASGLVVNVADEQSPAAQRRSASTGRRSGGSTPKVVGTNIQYDHLYYGDPRTPHGRGGRGGGGSAAGVSTTATAPRSGSAVRRRHD